jgi:hypothetical protein
VIRQGLVSFAVLIAVLSVWNPVRCKAEEVKTLVLVIDRDSKTFTYRVDGKDTSADFLTYLDAHKSEWPSGKTRVILLVHERASLAMINNSRGMIMKAGYEPPRVFQFNKDKRLMVEITFLPGVPFSEKGPS